MMLNRKLDIPNQMSMEASCFTSCHILWLVSQCGRYSIRKVTRLNTVCCVNNGLRCVTFTSLHAKHDGCLLVIHRHLRRWNAVLPYEIAGYGQENDNHRQSDGGVAHGPTEKPGNQLPHGSYPEWMAWVFLVRAAVMAFLFMDSGLYLFRHLYAFVGLQVMPVVQDAAIRWDICAYQHGPIVVTGLFPLITGFLLLFIQASPWLCGFGTASFIVWTFYRITVRIGKLPPWSDYPQIFRLRDKP